MRPWLAVVFCALLGWGPAWAACAGPPHDQFDFWLGEWHDPAAPAAEHYAVRRTAGDCAIEEVLTGGNGQIQGIGVSGWDSERKQWRQLWADADRIVTVYMGGPVADRDVRPHVRTKRRRNAVAVHVSEHPARWRRRRICLAWRRRRSLDHGVVGSLRSDRTGGKITAPGHRAASCSKAIGVVQTRVTCSEPQSSAARIAKTTVLQRQTRDPEQMGNIGCCRALAALVCMDRQRVFGRSRAPPPSINVAVRAHRHAFRLYRRQHCSLAGRYPRTGLVWVAARLELPAPSAGAFLSRGRQVPHSVPVGPHRGSPPMPLRPELAPWCPQRPLPPSAFQWRATASALPRTSACRSGAGKERMVPSAMSGRAQVARSSSSQAIAGVAVAGASAARPWASKSRKRAKAGFSASHCRCARRIPESTCRPDLAGREVAIINMGRWEA